MSEKNEKDVVLDEVPEVEETKVEEPVIEIGRAHV